MSSCTFLYTFHLAACTENTAHCQWNGIWSRHKPLRRHRNLICRLQPGVPSGISSHLIPTLCDVQQNKACLPCQRTSANQTGLSGQKNAHLGEMRKSVEAGRTLSQTGLTQLVLEMDPGVVRRCWYQGRGLTEIDVCGEATLGAGKRINKQYRCQIQEVSLRLWMGGKAETGI